MQNTPELIAPCGMNCGICIAFFGYTMNGKKRTHVCNGCRSKHVVHTLTLDKHLCAFLKKHCEKLKQNQIKYCFECPDFPCEKLQTLDKSYQTKYGMSTIDNLRFIQTHGIQQFLANEQERWKCPTCGGIICVHTKICYTCQQTSSRKSRND